MTRKSVKTQEEGEEDSGLLCSELLWSISSIREQNKQCREASTHNILLCRTKILKGLKSFLKSENAIIPLLARIFNEAA